MYKKFAGKLGVNYVWGLANYTAGVVCGSIVTGVLSGYISVN